jgi:hypothetical protein
MKKAHAILALLLLAGCETKSTGDQLYVSESSHEATFPKDYEALTACVLQAIDGKYRVVKSVDRANGIANITSEIRSRNGLALPLWDVEIRRVDATHSDAGTASLSNSKGTLLPDDVWPAVEACGKAS